MCRAESSAYRGISAAGWRLNASGGASEEASDTGDWVTCEAILARKEHRTTPKVIGSFLYSEREAVRLESPAWFAWLAHNGSFYLEGPTGSFTARREQRAGAVFWYAFRRYRKQLYKAYLGRPGDLTQARLLAVAQQLAEKAGA